MSKMQTIAREIRSDLKEIERNARLFEEASFNARVEAIDQIEFNIIERIEGLLYETDGSEELVGLKQRAEKIKGRLEEINHHLFQRLREEIRAGTCRGAALKREIGKFVGSHSKHNDEQKDGGYDNLDVFINGLLLTKPAPSETKEREPEMVRYQPTPARILLELVEKGNLTEEGVFYDLGSGLGQVPILVNLLSGARAKGVEFEPAFCDYARACAVELTVSEVEFINADAREADYTDGTVFFMYTPFRGRMQQEVLDKLQGEAQGRTIRLFTYGPCTAEVSRQSWLQRVDGNGDKEYKLGEFESLEEHG